MLKVSPSTLAAMDAIELELQENKRKIAEKNAERQRKREEEAELEQKRLALAQEKIKLRDEQRLLNMDILKKNGITAVFQPKPVSDENDKSKANVGESVYASYVRSRESKAGLQLSPSAKYRHISPLKHKAVVSPTSNPAFGHRSPRTSGQYIPSTSPTKPSSSSSSSSSSAETTTASTAIAEAASAALKSSTFSNENSTASAVATGSLISIKDLDGLELQELENIALDYEDVDDDDENASASETSTAVPTVAPNSLNTSFDSSVLTSNSSSNNNNHRNTADSDDLVKSVLSYLEKNMSTFSTSSSSSASTSASASASFTTSSAVKAPASPAPTNIKKFKSTVPSSFTASSPLATNGQPRRPQSTFGKVESFRQPHSPVSSAAKQSGGLSPAILRKSSEEQRLKLLDLFKKEMDLELKIRASSSQLRTLYKESGKTEAFNNATREFHASDARCKVLATELQKLEKLCALKQLKPASVGDKKGGRIDKRTHSGNSTNSAAEILARLQAEELNMVNDVENAITATVTIDEIRIPSNPHRMLLHKEKEDRNNINSYFCVLTVGTQTISTPIVETDGASKSIVLAGPYEFTKISSNYKVTCDIFWQAARKTNDSKPSTPLKLFRSFSRIVHSSNSANSSSNTNGTGSSGHGSSAHHSESQDEFVHLGKISFSHNPTALAGLQMTLPVVFSPEVSANKQQLPIAGEALVSARVVVNEATGPITSGFLNIQKPIQEGENPIWLRRYCQLQGCGLRMWQYEEDALSQKAPLSEIDFSECVVSFSPTTGQLVSDPVRKATQLECVINTSIIVPMPSIENPHIIYTDEKSELTVWINAINQGIREYHAWNTFRSTTSA